MSPSADKVGDRLAGVAQSADADDSKSSVLTDMRVRVPSPVQLTDPVGVLRHGALVHPAETVASVQALFSSGRTTRDIAREVGLPEATVGHWRRGDRRSGPGGGSCPRCTAGTLPDSYAYLLGSYLGRRLHHRPPTRCPLAVRLLLRPLPGRDGRSGGGVVRGVRHRGVPRPPGRLHRGQVLLEALDVRLPAARSRQEAHPPHRPRAVAAGGRRAAHRRVPARGCSTPTAAGSRTGRRAGWRAR